MNVQQVQSIERLHGITQVPRAPDFIKGVLHLRGEITPIIDLKERLDMGETDYTGHTRVLIVTMNQTQVGFVVDKATDVMDIENVLNHEQVNELQNAAKASSADTEGG